ncbi:MAG: hypothetical protein CMH52_12190 [Myxococcales bacterium]|nr:hypothetical protein [Myxococcales bacterium]
MGQDRWNQLETLHSFSLTDQGRRYFDLRRKTPVDPVSLEQNIVDSWQDNSVQTKRRQEVALLGRMDGRIVTSTCREWPIQIRQPGVIRYLGRFCRRRRLGIVGTRYPDAYGLDITNRIACAAAKADIVVVSGGALGIDGHAHRCALDAGGRTMVVLGSGLMYRSPKSHFRLFDRAIEHGVVMSPFPVDVHPSKWSFPYRNPWIAACVTDLVVVQAGPRSGALQTARYALDNGIRVWVVPGAMDNPRHHGCHLLLKEGAVVLLKHNDWLADSHGNSIPLEQKQPMMDLNYWTLFDDKPRSLEEVCRLSSCSLEKLIAASVRLEANGWLSRRQGAHFVRRYSGRP